MIADLPEQDEYEVRVYDISRERTLVAAVEIISPSSKDRPEHRRTFVAKCAAFLQRHVSAAIVDLVTTRQFNLYADLLELVGQTDPSLSPESPPLYAAACRRARERDAWQFRAWVIRWWLASRRRHYRFGSEITRRCLWSQRPATRRPAAPLRIQ